MLIQLIIVTTLYWINTKSRAMEFGFSNWFRYRYPDDSGWYILPNSVREYDDDEIHQSPCYSGLSYSGVTLDP